MYWLCCTVVEILYDDYLVNDTIQKSLDISQTNEHEKGDATIPSNPPR